MTQVYHCYSKDRSVYTCHHHDTDDPATCTRPEKGLPICNRPILANPSNNQMVHNICQVQNIGHFRRKINTSPETEQKIQTRFITCWFLSVLRIRTSQDMVIFLWSPNTCKYRTYLTLLSATCADWKWSFTSGWTVRDETSCCHRDIEANNYQWTNSDHLVKLSLTSNRNDTNLAYVLSNALNETNGSVTNTICCMVLFESKNRSDRMMPIAFYNHRHHHHDHSIFSTFLIFSHLHKWNWPSWDDGDDAHEHNWLS